MQETRSHFHPHGPSPNGNVPATARQAESGADITRRQPVAILIPIYNDWESVERLLLNLDKSLDESGHTARILLVNDGSTNEPGESLGITAGRLHAIRRIDHLRLRCNLGHQRAIAVGLAHLHSLSNAISAVVVMDGDGEDRPADVPVYSTRWTGLAAAALSSLLELAV